MTDYEYQKILVENVKKRGYLDERLEPFVNWWERFDEEIINTIRQIVTYQIVGMRSEKYIGKSYYRHNQDVEEKEEEFLKDVICCTKDGKNFEIALYTTYDSVGGSYGHLKMNEVEEFGEITAEPKEETSSFEFIYNYMGQVDCPAFSYFEAGEDFVSGIPYGSAGAKKDFFVEKDKTINDKNVQLEHESEQESQSKLDDKTVEELQAMLNSKVSENEAKKAELERIELERKQELIKAIREAQEESSRLDELLNNARNKKEI